MIIKSLFLIVFARLQSECESTSTFNLLNYSSIIFIIDWYYCIANSEGCGTRATARRARARDVTRETESHARARVWSWRAGAETGVSLSVRDTSAPHRARSLTQARHRTHHTTSLHSLKGNTSLSNRRLPPRLSLLRRAPSAIASPSKPKRKLLPPEPGVPAASCVVACPIRPRDSMIGIGHD